MSKFKKGDWVLESDVEPGDMVKDYGYRIHDVLPNGDYVVEVNANEYSVWNEGNVNDCAVEPRCTGWDWVLPEPANRFGLKVGDTVTIKPHDARDGYVSTSHVITEIDDSFRDGIARFRLDDMRPYPWHPYYFGLCQSDGSPLPPKPAAKKVLLEEWCVFGSDRAIFEWHVEGRQIGKTDTWFKTGVTRELEVPDVK